MGKTLGYMITWTTYGSWLQGDKRGYVKDGIVLGGNDRLQKNNKEEQKEKKDVKLNKQERQIVRQALMTEAVRLGQKIYAISIGSQHVHVVEGSGELSISKVVGYYKSAARIQLQKGGFAGRVWTKGYDKRYCFDEVTLANRINYVREHES